MMRSLGRSRAHGRVDLLRRHLTTQVPAAGPTPSTVARLAEVATSSAVTHRMSDAERVGTGIVTVDHEFDVPLDWLSAGGERLTVFAREVVALKQLPKKESLPWLVFLQGGPGGASPRPTGANGWLKRALQDHRVLLLDQRGTGRSTPVTVETLVTRFGADDAGMAAYLGNFRADAIVSDLECIRHTLLGSGSQWSTLGQSYGGWITLHYLSVAPQALRACYVAGGLACIQEGTTADDIYRATYPVVLRRNEQYYRQYPADVERVRRIIAALAACPGGGAALPGGGLLTPRRFLSLGLGMGMHGGLEQMHWLIENALRHDGQGLAYDFLRQCENAQSFETGPIFAVLHEAIYQVSEGQAPSAWAAQRVQDQHFRDEFDWEARLQQDAAPIQFTGEHIFPWMFDDFGQLTALKAAADRLAYREDWPALCELTKLLSLLVSQLVRLMMTMHVFLFVAIGVDDLEKLRNISVPLAAAMYHDDTCEFLLLLLPHHSELRCTTCLHLPCFYCVESI